MENPEEVLHSLEEFSKVKPKDIPRELEEYLCFVAKTGNPVYQWPIVKSLFREKLLSVITDFYESCPSVDIPPCPNVEMFNYDLMKNFILEKLDTFAAAPFTVQRICELLTTPRKEYNRIDKYMRALEKNILVVSTTEPGRRSTENGEGIMNGIESEHLPESSNSSHDINVEEMDDSPTWPRVAQVAPVLFENSESQVSTEVQQIPLRETFENSADTKLEVPSSSTSTVHSSQPQIPDQQDTVITCRSIDEAPYVSIEPVPLNTCGTSHQEAAQKIQADSSVTITAVPAGVQQRRNSVERVDSSENISKDSEAKTETTEEKSPKKDEEVSSPKEEISSTVLCPEPIGEPATETKIVMHSEEPTIGGQEELGIENISPENSSSSPEILQIDTTSEQEKIQPEKTEKSELTPEQPSEAKELNTNKWVEEEKDPLLQQESDSVVAEETDEDLRDQDLDGIPLDQVADTEDEDLSEDKNLDENTHLSKSIEESVEKSSVPEERDKAENEPAVETPVSSELESKTDSDVTPMDVDVINEAEEKKKDEPETDEPTSTSDATTL